MPTPTAVILIVALTEPLIGEWSPNLLAFSKRGRLVTLTPPLPAVTCTSQSTMLTGTAPDQHGIVGNGWYDHESAEIRFWKQSNRLVHGPKVWETARERDPAVTTANICWWYNMYSTVDRSITPRPQYRADGRKIPDCYTEPAGWRDELQQRLGDFPLFRFWGPAADVTSSEWIADAAIDALERDHPTLNLVYLPHLDYALQKFGPNGAEAREAVTEIDAVFGRLLEAYDREGVRVMVCSEYGIDEVSDAVPINRILRERGLLRVREENGRDLMDPGASEAFAVADHQVAHVYVRDPAATADIAGMCDEIPGVERTLHGEARAAAGLDHPRAGGLVLVSARDRWFCHDEWTDARRAPDYARTVDIHRKPGYDPRELFVDPAFRFPKLAIGSRIIRRKLGFRTPLDVIPLDPTLVRGSHGRVTTDSPQRPLLIGDRGVLDAIAPAERSDVSLAAVHDAVLESMGLR